MSPADAAVFLLPTGLLAGVCLGYIARKNFFCTLASLERLWYSDDSSSFRTWMLAALIAAALTQLASYSGLIDVSDSFYLLPQFNPLASIIGGLLFGFGMALVGTCGFSALVRLGGGSLKSLIVVLVLGLTAMATQTGLLAFARLDQLEFLTISFANSATQSIPDLSESITGTGNGGWVAAFLIFSGLAWVFSNPEYRRNRKGLETAVGVGAIIFFGWFATTWIAANSFEATQIESASFVAPVSDTIFQFALQIGTVADYGVGMVIGTIAGAAIAAKTSDDMQWEACDDVPELRRHIFGAMLMGYGGILSVGCTVGQGISAMSLLTLSAPVTLISIIVGARMGLAYLLEGSMFDPFIRR